MKKYEELLIELEHLRLFNSKMTYIVKILSSFELTQEEKLDLMKKFDNIQTIEEAEVEYKDFLKSKK